MGGFLVKSCSACIFCIQSPETGITLGLRLTRNVGWSFTTLSRRGLHRGIVQWSLVYTKKYPTKSEAWKAERRIKKRKSRKYVEAVVRGQVAF